MDETQEEIDGANKEREESGDEAAKQLALKAGAEHVEHSLELRVSNLEEMLKSVIKQNCLRTEGGR